MGAVLLLNACGTPQNEQTQNASAIDLLPIPYDLSQPTQRFSLPDELEEISGLTYFRNGQLLCIQDEAALAYVFDLKREQITDEYKFGKSGDFEGIEWVNEHGYALRSNGSLFRFKPGAEPVEKLSVDLPNKLNLEGLGYDPKADRLLLAVKEGAGKRETVIYAVDLNEPHELEKIVISEAKLESVGIDARRFKPSGMAVHPITGEWYILSSAGKQLLVTDAKGNPKTSVSLVPNLFRQPEGICFAPNGDLYIASEGAGSNGYILSFSYQR